MTSAEGKRWVLGALVASALLASFADLGHGRPLPRARILVGAVIAAALLSALAEIEPELATSFAAIIAVGAVLSRGEVITKVVNLFGGQ